MQRLLIANRGEIAIRIALSAADLGLARVAVFSEDDAQVPHTRACDQALSLRGLGPVPYLDAEQLVAAALDSGCDAVHPGYGFLSENADFARRCAAAGLVFVGPDPATVTGLGLVAIQLRIARGATLADLGLTQPQIAVRRLAHGAWRRRRYTWSTTSNLVCRCASECFFCPSRCACCWLHNPSW